MAKKYDKLNKIKYLNPVIRSSNFQIICFSESSVGGKDDTNIDSEWIYEEQSEIYSSFSRVLPL